MPGTMIAAHALACNAILVSNNIREFERVPGLRLENWASGPLESD
jgi:tRNA(fMet)-specific endonuclease VapC